MEFVVSPYTHFTPDFSVDVLPAISGEKFGNGSFVVFVVVMGRGIDRAVLSFL